MLNTQTNNHYSPPPPIFFFLQGNSETCSTILDLGDMEAITGVSFMLVTLQNQGAGGFELDGSCGRRQMGKPSPCL